MMPGNMDSKVATARTEADLVFSVIHHTKPNCATALPIQERVCPVQMVKNRGIHFEGFQLKVHFDIINLSTCLYLTDTVLAILSIFLEKGNILGLYHLNKVPFLKDRI
jgi:hypothetical protein